MHVGGRQVPVYRCGVTASPEPRDESADARPKLGHGLEYADDGKNYYEWLADSFAPHLRAATADRAAKRSVVEHGAGTGALSRLLLERGAGPMVLTEPDPALAEMLQATYAGRPDVEVAPGTLEAYLERVGPGAADAIVSSNVLEHVVDDVACLRAMWTLLRPGGVLTLYVPARPELYGQFDREVGHQRRYRRGELRQKVQAAGFEIGTLKYRNLVGTAGWFLLGRLLNKRGVGKGSVWLYDRLIFPVSRFVEDLVPPPYGLNLLCLATKRA
jgi:SAM-dependent methyltransferase